MPAQHRYIAFLRAINVGGRVVKMDSAFSATPPRPQFASPWRRLDPTSMIYAFTAASSIGAVTHESAKPR